MAKGDWRMPARTCSKAIGRSWLSCAAGVFACLAPAPVNANSLPEVQLAPNNAVPACVTPDRLMAYLKARNSVLSPRYQDIAAFYKKHGRALKLRWDHAFFHMIVETASLSYRRSDGTASDVQPAQNNFAGLGAVGNGAPGEAFASIEHGVRAHLEHVLHYAGVHIAEPVAQRTRKVQEWQILASWHAELRRPVTFADLAQRWAPNTPGYGATIAAVAARFFREYCPDSHPVLTGQDSTAKLAAASIIPLRLKRPPSPVSRPVSRPKAPVTRPPARVEQKKPKARPPVASKPAKPKPPSKADLIREMVSGRKVYIKTSLGAVIPVTFLSDGSMRGHAPSLSFVLGSSSDRGRWWVEKARLCKKWRIWLNRKKRCIRLTQRGKTVYWRSDDGRSGTARIGRQISSAQRK